MRFLALLEMTVVVIVVLWLKSEPLNRSVYGTWVRIHRDHAGFFKRASRSRKGFL